MKFLSVMMFMFFTLGLLLAVGQYPNYTSGAAAAIFQMFGSGLVLLWYIISEMRK